jgi:hypothetical protein
MHLVYKHAKLWVQNIIHTGGLKYLDCDGLFKRITEQAKLTKGCGAKEGDGMIN